MNWVASFKLLLFRNFQAVAYKYWSILRPKFDRRNSRGTGNGEDPGQFSLRIYSSSGHGACPRRLQLLQRHDLLLGTSQLGRLEQWHKLRTQPQQRLRYLAHAVNYITQTT